MSLLMSLGGFFSKFLELLTQTGSPLMFYNGLFWFLMIVFIPVYAALKSRRKQMMLFVTAFSLFLAWKASGLVFLFMVLTAVMDWFLAKKIYKEQSKGRKRFYAAVSIVASLGLLIAFKYTGFLLLSFNDLFSTNFQPLTIIAPIGISFYTFRTISYTADVYSGKCKPADDVLEYAFFLTFFPCMIAGPVARARDFLPQIKENRPACKSMIYGGLYLFLMGVVKKAVFADYISQYVDLAFGNPVSYSGFELMMAGLAFTLQLYCDFSGYSDMAIGLAAIMGYDLGINFDFPFRSLNITEFWRRWHISLSFWIRDYLYIPMGGNRKGKIRQHINLMVSMLLGGLWHGASWNYVIWGGGHGIALCLHKLLKKSIGKIKDTFAVRFVSWWLTFSLVCLLFIFFRADTFSTASHIIKGIFTNFSIAYLPPFIKARWILCTLLALIFALHFVPKETYCILKEKFIKSPWLVKLIVLMAVAAIVTYIQGADVKPFIYAQY